MVQPWPLHVEYPNTPLDDLFSNAAGHTFPSQGVEQIVGPVGDSLWRSYMDSRQNNHTTSCHQPEAIGRRPFLWHCTIHISSNTLRISWLLAVPASGSALPTTTWTVCPCPRCVVEKGRTLQVLKSIICVRSIAVHEKTGSKGLCKERAIFSWHQDRSVHGPSFLSIKTKTDFSVNNAQHYFQSKEPCIS